MEPTYAGTDKVGSHALGSTHLLSLAFQTGLRHRVMRSAASQFLLSGL